MVIRVSLVLFVLVFAAEIGVADNSPSNLVVNGREVNDSFFEVVPVTNVTEVGWAIMSTLECSVDARCALLVRALRERPKGAFSKEECRKALIDADFYGNLIKRDVENAFHLAIDLQKEVSSRDELKRAVSACVLTNEDKARLELQDRLRFLTSPPTSGIEMLQASVRDYKWWMSEKDRYHHMLLCAYFKSVIMQTCLSYLAQNVKMEETVSARMRFEDRNIRDEEIVPSNDDIDFVFYVVTNQTAKCLDVTKGQPKGEQGNPPS